MEVRTGSDEMLQITVKISGMDGPLEKRRIEPAQEGIHFDVIQHPLLFAMLKAYGVDVESCALLKDYLSLTRQIDLRGLRLGTHSLTGKVSNNELLRVAFWDPHCSIFL